MLCQSSKESTESLLCTKPFRHPEVTCEFNFGGILQSFYILETRHWWISRVIFNFVVILYKVTTLINRWIQYSVPESKQGTHSLKYEDDASYYSVIKSTCAWCFCFIGSNKFVPTHLTFSFHAFSVIFIPYTCEMSMLQTKPKQQLVQPPGST